MFNAQKLHRRVKKSCCGTRLGSVFGLDLGLGSALRAQNSAWSSLKLTYSIAADV